MDIAGFLLSYKKLPQSVWRNTRKNKDISSKYGQSSIEIHSVLPTKNPKYRILAHETFLQSGAHIVDTAVKNIHATLFQLLGISWKCL